MTTMQQMIGDRATEMRRKKKRERGVVAPAPRTTLRGQKRNSLLTDIVDISQELINNEELWIANTALSYVIWCKTGRMAQSRLETERKEWMRENKVTYADLRKYLPAHYEANQHAHTLKELKLTSGKIVPKGSIGYVTKLPEKGLGPEIKFKVKGEGKESREVFRTQPDDAEPIQHLLQWGWRPARRPDDDSDTETDEE
eukprot:TRINITY_DN4345_c1_g1_i1.p1 TRINITY_DN4345_c1_g1~~TRINITY_DN4345_c1_g1_i1.p1  ORF type:complete len:199 (+),score=47.40 TRINITY_DN4345_c1_g1_i1:57-653(+)